MLTGVRAIRVRRSPHLVAIGAVPRSSRATTRLASRPSFRPRLPRILSSLRRLDEARSTRSGRASSIGRSSPAIVARMVALTLLERSDRRRDPGALAMDSLRAWNPQAGYFHTTTKNLRFASPAVVARRRLTSDRRPPAAIKRYPKPRDDRSSAARREWRAGDIAPRAAHLAAILAEAHRSRRARNHPRALGGRSALGRGR